MMDHDSTVVDRWGRRRPGRRRHRADQRGAAAVEFALVMVPLLVVILGVISYGFLLGFRQSVSQAAAEAARAAAVAPSAADREAIAERAIADVLGVDCTDALLTCSFPVQPCAPDCIAVTVEYAYGADPTKPVFPGSSVAIPDTLSYTAVSRTS